MFFGVCPLMALVLAQPAQHLPSGARAGIGTQAIVRNDAKSLMGIAAPDYTKFVFGDSVKGIRLRDAGTGRWLSESTGIPSGNVVLSADGSRAAVVRGRECTFWDVKSGAALDPFRPPGTFASPQFADSHLFALSRDGGVFVHSSLPAADRKCSAVVWDVVNARVRQEIALPRRDTMRVALSPDGKVLATWFISGIGPNRGIVQSWDTSTGVEKFQFTISGRTPLCVSFSTDGECMAVSSEASIDVFNAKSSKPVCTVHGQLGQGRWLAFSPDGKKLGAISLHGTVDQWSLPEGRHIGTTKLPPALPYIEVHGIVYPDNERLLVWGGCGRLAVAWEAPSAKILTPIGKHIQGIESLAFSPDGRELVSSTNYGPIRRWDAATGEPRGEISLKGPLGSSNLVQFSSNGARGLTSGSAWIAYDVSTAEPLFALPGSPPVGGHKFLPVHTEDQSRCALVATPFDLKQSGSALVWDLNARKKLSEFEVPGSPPFGGDAAAAISAKGSRLALATNLHANSRSPTESLVHTWDVAKGRKFSVVSIPGAHGSGALAWADEREFVFATHTLSWLHSPLQMWVVDCESGTVTRRLKPILEEGFIANRPMLYNRDRTRFAMAVSNGPMRPPSVRVYDWPNCTTHRTFTGHSMEVTCLAFSPDGRTLASGSRDTSILLWDLAK